MNSRAKQWHLISELRPCAFTEAASSSGNIRFWSDYGEWTVAFLTFMMNFFKGSFSICHSFRSAGQSGRMKGSKRCLQVLQQCSRRQQNGYAARLTLMTSVLGRNEIKLHQLHLGKKEPFEGIFESRLRKVESFLGEIEFLSGKIEPLLGKI